MFCPNCGKEIPGGSKFCPYCGAKIDGRLTSVPIIVKKEGQRRKKNILFILIPIIIFLVVLGVLLSPRYMSMVNQAKKERAKNDLTSIAVALEFYKTDWGVYPIVVVSEEFGKPANNTIVSSMICKELTGTGAAVNRPGNTTFAGEDGGIEYLKTQTLQAMYNPFNSTKGYNYATDSAGTTWILWVEINDKDSLYRTDKNSYLTQCATSEVPKPNQSFSNKPINSMSSNPIIGRWQAFSIYGWNGWLDVSEANVIYEFSSNGTFAYSSVDGSGSGSYEVIDENHLQMMDSGATVGDVVEFSITGDELTLGTDPTDPKQVMRLRRTEKNPTNSNSDMQEKARRANVASDFSSLAVALEFYKTDWGQYPVETDYTLVAQYSNIYKELTGLKGALLNSAEHSTLAGEKGPFEYLGPETLNNSKSPWDGSPYLYKSTEEKDWILVAKMLNGNYLVRTSYNPTLTEVGELP